MIDEFLILAGPKDQISQKQLSRFETLSNRGAASLEFGKLRLWAKHEKAIVRRNGFALCGSAELNNRDSLLECADANQDLHGTDQYDDLQLIMFLVCKEGPDALRRLAGRFALMLWDEETELLTVIRDPFGQQPLYMANTDAGPIIASDLRLLAHVKAEPLASRELSQSAFLCGFEEGEIHTAWKELHRFPRAHLLQWGGEGETQPIPYETLALPAALSRDEARSGLRFQLARAMKRHQRVNRPLGYMLSGGLDSSSLVMLAAESEDAPRTLSFVYRQTDSYDESRFIDAIIERASARATKIAIDGPPSPEDLPQLLDEQFDLCAAPGLLKSRKIYAKARDMGLHALVDGHGGDEVISHGYLYQAELARKGAYLQLWRQMRGAAKVYGDPVLGPYLAHLYHYAPLPKRSLLRRGLGWVGRRLEKREKQPATAISLLDESYLSEQHIETRLEASNKVYGFHEGAPNEREAHLRNLTSPLMVSAFEVLHRSAAAQDVQPLYPFFDADLVNFCLSAPPDAKLRNGWSRHYLREAMEGVLPKAIQWRHDKADFNSEVSDFVVAFFKDPARLQMVKDQLSKMVQAHVLEDCISVIERNDGKNSASIVQILWRCIYLASWRDRIALWNRRQSEGVLW